MTLNDLCKMKNLTRTQTLVMNQIVGSGSVKSISQVLHKSPSVIKHHIWRIYKIFGVDTRYELIAEVTKLLNKYSNPDLEVMLKRIDDLTKRVEALENKPQGFTLPIGKSNT